MVHVVWLSIPAMKSLRWVYRSLSAYVLDNHDNIVGHAYMT